MKCAICLFVKTEEAFEAVSIISGTAVCEYHLTSSDDKIQAALRNLSVWEGRIQYLTDADFGKE